jgi:hypothetical protein
MFSNDGTIIFSTFSIAIFIIILCYKIKIQLMCFSNYFYQNVGHLTRLYPSNFSKYVSKW